MRTYWAAGIRGGGSGDFFRHRSSFLVCRLIRPSIRAESCLGECSFVKFLWNHPSLDLAPFGCDVADSRSHMDTPTSNQKGIFIRSSGNVVMATPPMRAPFDRKCHGKQNAKPQTLSNTSLLSHSPK